MSMLCAAMARRKVGYEVLLGYLEGIWRLMTLSARESTSQEYVDDPSMSAPPIAPIDVDIEGSLLPLTFRLTTISTSPLQDTVKILPRSNIYTLERVRHLKCNRDVLLCSRKDVGNATPSVSTSSVINIIISCLYQ